MPVYQNNPMISTGGGGGGGLLPPTGSLASYATPGVSTQRAPRDYTKPKEILNFLGNQSTGMLETGQEWLQGGQQSLAPVLAYLQKLLSGDPALIEEAIRPEVASVLSQYDTARRSISEFTPRGGGQAGAATMGMFAQAGDIANLRATARRSAVGELSQLGLGQAQVGSEIQRTGMYGLGNVLQGAEAEAASRRQMWTDIGMGVGSIAAMIFAPYLAPVLAPTAAGSFARGASR